MIIAIDGNEANVPQRVGVNRFAYEVVCGLYRLRSQENKFLIFLKDSPKDDLPKEDKNWQYEVFGPKPFWTSFALSKRLYLNSPKPDIIFSPSHYGPLFSPIPSVISIMDLGFLHWPNQFTKKDFFQLKYMTRLSIKRAKKIIAISEFTKQDIVNTYGIKPEKIVVAYPGVNQTKNKKLKAKNKYGKYILFLGTLKPSKNINGLIEAFKLLDEKDLKLIITGKKGWLYQQIFEKVKELDLEEKVIFTGFVSDQEAEKLLKNAEVFVLPSFWEGFGIPAVEAMAVGIPVVASNAGSLPEILGNAAVIVDPNKPEDIAAGIKKAINDAKLRKQLVAAGRERALVFNWQNCCKIIYETLIK